MSVHKGGRRSAGRTGHRRRRICPGRAGRLAGAAAVGTHLERLEDRLLLSTTWYVDDSVSRSGDGTSAATAFGTIGRGVRAAHDGDIVMVEPGTYRESLRIDKPLRLVGSGAAITTLTASGSAPAITIDFDPAEDIQTAFVERVIIDGLTIVEGSSSAARPVEITDGSRGVTIGHSVLDASAAADAAVNVAGYASELTFFSNVFRYRRIGIDMSDGVEDLNKISITDSEFCPSPAGGEPIGIRVAHAEDVIIAQNTWYAPSLEEGKFVRGVAVAVDDVQDLGFSENIIWGIDADTEYVGLSLHGAKGTALITGNEFRNLSVGVIVEDTDEGPPCATVILGRVGDGNYFFGNGTAVWISTGATAEIDSLSIAGNTFRNNETGLLIGSPSETGGTDTGVGLVWIHDNDFGDSNGRAICSWEMNPDVDRIRLESNWFGEPTGAVHPSNPAGTGGVVAGQFLLESTEPTATPGFDLSVQLNESAGTLPLISVPGDSGSVPVIIRNEGDLRAVGSVEVEVFLSADAALDDTVDILVSSRTIRISLAPGGELSVPVRLEIEEFTPGSYLLVARIRPAEEVGTEGSLDNNVDFGQLPRTIQWSCGNIPGRRGSIVLTVTNPETGDPVRFRLVGPGTATVDAELNITVDDSTRRTRLFVLPRRGQRVDVGDVTFNGAVGALIAPRAELTGSLSVTAGPAGAILLDTISGPSVDVFGSVGLLRAAEITSGGTITVDRINVLQVTGRRGSSPLDGDFAASLMANNFGDRFVGVGFVFIAGDASDGAITARSGSINTVIVNGWMDNFGIFAAGNVNFVSAGAMMDSAILAGSNPDHTGLAEGTTAHIGNVVVTARRDSTGLSFANTVLGAAVVHFARLRNVSPNNASSTPPAGVDLTPDVSDDFGVFVTDTVGVVVANLPDTRAVRVREPVDTPIFEPDFFVRMIPVAAAEVVVT